MDKKITHMTCKYCNEFTLEFIGYQELDSYKLSLANCTNEKCKPYTMVVEKILIKGAA